MGFLSRDFPAKYLVALDTYLKVLALPLSLMHTSVLHPRCSLQASDEPISLAQPLLLSFLLLSMIASQSCFCTKNTRLFWSWVFIHSANAHSDLNLLGIMSISTQMGYPHPFGSFLSS